MYWYDFPKNEIYVGEGGEYKRKHFRAVTSAEREKIEKLFADHILKIFYTDESSYDNSDDERASDSY